jgi:hypothetical protein
MSKTDLKENMGVTDAGIMALILRALAYKSGGFELTQQDMLNFVNSGAEIGSDIDENGTLIYTVKNGKEGK